MIGAGKRLGGGKTGNAEAADRAFRTARHHDIRVIVGNHPRRIANGVGTGGTGGHHGVVRALVAVTDGDLSRDEIDQGARNEERADAAGAALMQRDGVRLDRGQAADAGTDGDTGAAEFLFRRGLPAAVLDGLIGGGNAENDEAVDFPLFLGFQHVIGNEGVGLVRIDRHFTAIADRQVRRVDLGQHPCAGFAVNQLFPGRLDPVRQRGHKSQAGYHHSSHASPNRYCAEKENGAQGPGRSGSFDMRDRVFNRQDFLGCVIRNLDAEFLFKSHHQLNRIQAVCAQIVNEARFVRYLAFIYTEMFNDDFFYAPCDITHSCILRKSDSSKSLCPFLTSKVRKIQAPTEVNLVRFPNIL